MIRDPICRLSMQSLIFLIFISFFNTILIMWDGKNAHPAFKFCHAIRKDQFMCVEYMYGGHAKGLCRWKEFFFTD